MSFYTLSSTRCHFSNTGLSKTRIMGPRDGVGLLSFFLATQAQHQYLFFLFLYTARPSCEYYRQVYFVHSRLQDESLQVTISKLPYGYLTCTGGDFPCTGDIQLTSRSKGRCTYLASSMQMTLEKARSDNEIFLAASGNLTWDL